MDKGQNVRSNNLIIIYLSRIVVWKTQYGIIKGMKNKQILDLFGALSGLTGLKGVSFNYALAKNINTLKAEVESLQKSIDSSDEYKEYDKKRVALAEKHSEKNEDGSAVVVDNQYQLRDKVAFEKELKKLQESNKEVIEAREKQLKDFEVLLDQESPVTLHKIKLEEIPEEITTEQMNAIYQLIEN